MTELANLNGVSFCVGWLQQLIKCEFERNEIKFFVNEHFLEIFSFK